MPTCHAVPDFQRLTAVDSNEVLRRGNPHGELVAFSLGVKIGRQHRSRVESASTQL